MTAAGMESSQPIVLDLGIGNLGNVERALRFLGVDPRRTADPSEVAAARTILLPGVGAFRPPRERLRGALEEALREAVDAGAWLLGICVGFQLLFEESDEHGATDGLGFLPGRIAKLPGGVPVPHMGWNEVRPTSAEHPLLAGLPDHPSAYFVHSYAPVGADGIALAETEHGVRFSSVAGRGRVLGTQFHPEKSGSTGLAILLNFLEMSRA